MPNYVHSGNLGDVIYSLPTVKHFGTGTFYVKLHGVPAAIRKYNNGPVFPEYEGRLSQNDFKWLAPLLEAQPYISDVKIYNNENIDYDLDLFRGTVGQAFKTNFIDTYAQTFNIPANFEPWLHVTPNKVANFVVTRTMRYHSNKTSTIPSWLSLIRDNKLATEGIFIGLPDEHKHFQDLFNISIPYYRCKDFLDMAEVIAGSNGFFSNQTFAYSLARGLGISTVLETLNWRPLIENECFFPLDGCYYF